MVESFSIAFKQWVVCTIVFWILAPFYVLFDHFSHFDGNSSCKKDLYVSKITACLKQIITIGDRLYATTAITIFCYTSLISDICWHRRWNICHTMNKRQICPLLSRHYPMSLLCPNGCLVWMGQTFNMLLLVNFCSFSPEIW